jgi:S-formylglutathione hydrolase FrmB
VGPRHSAPHSRTSTSLPTLAGSAVAAADDPKTSNGGVFADAAAFNKKVKVLFLGIGSAEGQGTKAFSEQLTQAGIKNIYYESPGTAHEWLTWRRCFKEFAPRLFR